MDAIVNAVSDLFAAVLGRFGHVGRARGRANIQEDLELLRQLQASPEFGPDSAASTNLADHISSEVARYSGAQPGPARPWASIVIAAFIAGPLIVLAYSLSADDLSWWSLLPGAGAFLMIMAIGQLLKADQETPADTAASPAAKS